MTALAFRRAHVTSGTPTAASGSVSVGVADPHNLISTGLAKVYKQKSNGPDNNDYETGQLVWITAYAGSVATMTLGAGSTQARVVNHGDWIEMADAMPGVYFAGQSRASIQGAINAASAAGGGQVRVIEDVTLDTTGLTSPAAGNVELCGFPGVTLSAPAAGAVAGGLIAFAGTASAESVIATTVNRKGLSVNHNQTGGLTFARGNITRLIDSIGMSQITRVRSVSGAAPQTVNLVDPLSVSFTTGNSSTVAKMTMIPGIYIHDLAFDANGNTASLRAINNSYLVGALYERLSFTGFKGTGLTTNDVANAFSETYCYESIRRDIKLYDSGTLGGVAAVQHANCSRCRDENYDIDSCGFAFVDVRSTHGTHQSIHIADCGEGLGVGGNQNEGGCYDLKQIDCWSNHITASGTGHRIRGGSAYIRRTNCGAIGCDSDGLFIAGTFGGEHDITEVNGYYEGNGIFSGYDLDVANNTIAPYAIEFQNTKYATRNDAGVGTIWNGALLAATGTPIVNSITRTALISKPLYAAQLTTLNALEGRMLGRILNNSGGNRTIIFEMQYGATAGIVKTTLNVPTSASYQPFELQFFMRDVAATNVQILHMTASIGLPTASGTGDGSLATAAPLLGPQPLIGDAAEDSTAAKTLAIYATCSANDFTVAPDYVTMKVVG